MRQFQFATRCGRRDDDILLIINDFIHEFLHHKLDWCGSGGAT